MDFQIPVALFFVPIPLMLAALGVLALPDTASAGRRFIAGSVALELLLLVLFFMTDYGCLSGDCDPRVMLADWVFPVAAFVAVPTVLAGAIVAVASAAFRHSRRRARHSSATPDAF